MTDYFDAHSVGLRLAEERERLKLTKIGLAEACGVRREMIGRYEKGEAAPGAEVLAKLIAMGADVPYILTGCRSVLSSTYNRAEAPESLPEPPPEAGPLARKKAKAKAMIDQLETEKGVDAVQAVLEGIAEAREMRGKPAAPRRQAG